MIDFKPVVLSDKAWMDKHFRAEDSRSGDFNFTNVFMWGNYFHLTAAVAEDRLVFRTEIGGKYYYSFPIGTGDMKAAVLAVTKDADERGLPFIMRSITANNAEKIDILFACLFDFKEERDYFDYIYSAEKLSTLSGKQLHAKRNYINRFEQNHKWSFEPVDSSNLELCVEMNSEWIRRHVTEENIDEYRGEFQAIDKAFRYFNELGLEGGILRADGQVVAFTIGEKLCSDTYIMHFEKAYADVDGAYPMINREFVRYIMQKYPEIVYINREDDMGSENLRRAKKSYYPEFMVEKFTAKPKKRRNEK